jgi:hypothetical protein
MSRRIVVLPHGLISTRLRAFQAIWRASLVRSFCITGSRSPGSSADRMQFGSTFLAESPQILAQEGGIGQLERVAGSTRQEGNGRPRDLRTGRLYAAAPSCRYGHGVHHQRPNQVATQRRSGGDLRRRSVVLLPPGAIHLVSANASNTDWAELIAVFVADEGAQLTTLIEP